MNTQTHYTTQKNQTAKRQDAVTEDVTKQTYQYLTDASAAAPVPTSLYPSFCFSINKDSMKTFDCSPPIIPLYPLNR